MPALSVSTSVVGPGEQLAYWREAVCGVYVPVNAEPQRAPDRVGFTGSIEVSEWADVDLSVVASDPQVVRRSKGPSDYCLVNFQVSGVSRVTQSGRTVVLRPGDFALHDATWDYRLVFDEPYEQVVMRFDRQQLIDRNVHLESATARVCSGGVGVSAVTSDLVRSLADLDPMDALTVA